jgi:hypothetical protein
MLKVPSKKEKTVVTEIEGSLQNQELFILYIGNAH